MTLWSGIRARTGRVGLLQSDGNIGSQTTKTVRLVYLPFQDLFGCGAPANTLVTSGTTRAPFGIGGRPVELIFETLGVARLEICECWLPLGLCADQRKRQPSDSVWTKQPSHSMYFFFTIRGSHRVNRLSSWQSLEETALPRMTATTAAEKGTRLAVLRRT